MKWKAAKSALMGDGIIRTIPLMYLGFSLHVEKAIVSYCREIFFELVSLSFELRRIWWSLAEVIKELGVPQEDGTLHALSNLFRQCCSHTQYTLCISSDE